LKDETLYVLKKGIKIIKSKEIQETNIFNNLIFPVILVFAILITILTDPKQQENLKTLNQAGQSIPSFFGISMMTFFGSFIVYLNNKQSPLCVMCGEIIDILEETIRRKNKCNI
jgi:amino acid transporter